MTYSEEGEGTITTYWLAAYTSNHDKVSATHDVTPVSYTHLRRMQYGLDKI